MHFPLRWKIMLAVVLAPVTLAVGALLTVHHRISERTHAEVHGDLLRASLIFETTLAERARILGTAAQVIVRDPRFFSALALPGMAENASYRRTVEGVARDFRKIGEADLFEVMDRSGRRVASVGKASSSNTGRQWLVEAARLGKRAEGLLVEDGAQYQVTLTPVTAGGERVGSLLLGLEIGGALARELETLTRSEVTFVSRGAITGTTAEAMSEADALMQSISAAPTAAAKSSEIQSVRAGGATFLTLARPIPGAAEAEQFYLMQRSLETETAHLAEVQNTLIQLGLVAVVAALVIGLLVSRRITQPILEVVRGAEEMERGNYEHPIEVRAKDEIGYLANRFQEMRRHEKVYVNSLQEVVKLKSEFISVASHELRTPVSIIKGFSEMFVQGQLGPMTPQQEQAAQAIDESVARLVRLAEDATRMAQIESERLVLIKEEHEIGKLVEEAAGAAVSDARNRKVEVTLEVAPELGRSVVDGPRLMQAVIQLVRNAIRFTPDGGTVDITAREESDHIVIEIADNGIGIPADKLPNLFNRVFSVRDSAHHHSSGSLEFNSAGLGLGLTIARGNVEAHGGTIEAQSTMGEGSRFIIRIPKVESSRHQSAA